MIELKFKCTLWKTNLPRKSFTLARKISFKVNQYFRKSGGKINAFEVLIHVPTKCPSCSTTIFLRKIVRQILRFRRNQFHWYWSIFSNLLDKSKAVIAATGFIFQIEKWELYDNSCSWWWEEDCLQVQHVWIVKWVQWGLQLVCWLSWA